MQKENDSPAPPEEEFPTVLTHEQQARYDEACRRHELRLRPLMDEVQRTERCGDDSNTLFTT